MAKSYQYNVYRKAWRNFHMSQKSIVACRNAKSILNQYKPFDLEVDARQFHNWLEEALCDRLRELNLTWGEI